MINKLILFTILMLSFSMGIAQDIKTYYVDINSIGGSCSDANSDNNTVNNPFCNISKALSKAKAGDVIYLRQGTYPPFSIKSMSKII